MTEPKPFRLSAETIAALDRASANIRRGFQRMVTNLDAALKATVAKPVIREALIEASRVDAYKQRVENERRQGMAYVKNYTARVRRDLGLPPE